MRRLAPVTAPQKLIQFAIVACLDDQKLPTEPWCSQFQIAHLISRRRIIRVHDRAENSDVGDDLLENSEPFLLHCVAQNDRPSHVAARTIKL